MWQEYFNPGRRRLLAAGVGALAGITLEEVRHPAAAATQAAGAIGGKSPTVFQIACMTYVYRDFTLQRALSGIAQNGYRFIAWGTTHQEEPGRRVPVLAPTSTTKEAERLAVRCRDLGLEPVLMFSNIYPERPEGFDVLKRRIEQAQAAGMSQVLTFGHTENGGYALWLERFAKLAPLAQEAGVTLVIKQHGGETGTGAACAKFTRELNHPAVKVNFDAGNVMDYLNVDPIADLKECVGEVRSFCIKDHRKFPKDEDCGPGFGEIDHYKLLHQVAFTGSKLTLACENIFPPLLPMPRSPQEIDRLALRAREYLETVITGLQARKD